MKELELKILRYSSWNSMSSELHIIYIVKTPPGIVIVSTQLSMLVVFSAYNFIELCVPFSYFNPLLLQYICLNFGMHNLCMLCQVQFSFEFRLAKILFLVHKIYCIALGQSSPSNCSPTIRSSERNKHYPQIVATASIRGMCTRGNTLTTVTTCQLGRFVLCELFPRLKAELRAVHTTDSVQ